MACATTPGRALLLLPACSHRPLASSGETSIVDSSDRASSQTVLIDGERLSVDVNVGGARRSGVAGDAVIDVAIGGLRRVGRKRQPVRSGIFGGDPGSGQTFAG